MSALELKIPPPAVAAIFGVFMWLVSSMFEAAGVPFGLRVGVAVVVACVGAVFGISGMGLFARAKTTVNPMKPSTASSLVTNGVFRVTRNPMYLSLLLYLVAWAVYLSNWLVLVFLPLFVLYMNEFQIKPEERAMSTLFDSQYDAYKARVRRWL